MQTENPTQLPEIDAGVTTVDRLTGAFLVGIGRRMRLVVMGRHYGAEDALPDAACVGLNRTGTARRFVAGHMLRHYGRNPSHWPLSARYFVQG
jgi:hypothetical protein